MNHRSLTEDPPAIQTANWPRLERPNIVGWATVLSLLLGVILLLIPGITRASVLQRGSIALGLLIFVPGGVWLAVLMAGVVSTVVRRIRNYPIVFDTAKDSELRVRTATDNLERLAKLAVISTETPRFSVLGAIERDRIAILVLRMEKSPRLNLGDHLLAVDTISYEVRGQFEVCEVDRDRYLVREVVIADPMWWGMVHKRLSEKNTAPPENTIAILIGQKEQEYVGRA